VWDYWRVVVIFAPSEDASPLSQRIAQGRRSWFFGHHADYAAATTVQRPSLEMQAFERAPHYLLDTRIMIAWATALDETGQTDRARHLAQRLREFRNPLADDFFAACDKPLSQGAARPAASAPWRKARRAVAWTGGEASTREWGGPRGQGPVRRYHARETFPECFLP
jgi:hypothetical protein